MRLHAEHSFAAAPRSVVDALLDPGFVPRLAALPDVGSVELVARDVGDTSGAISVRLSYDGAVEGIAAKVLGPTQPSWLQTYTFDLAACRGELTIVPDVHANLFDCSASIDVVGADDGSRRVVEGHLSVRVPLVGGKAERALAPAVVARIDREAALLSEWLAG